MGNAADHERGTIYRSESEATTQIVVESPPPPPPRQREVIYERPRSEAVWIEGYWRYEGRGYVWVSGYWETPPDRHRHYVPAHWERRGRHHVWVEGYWRG